MEVIAVLINFLSKLVIKILPAKLHDKIDSDSILADAIGLVALTMIFFVVIVLVVSFV
jgi:hypothetical protein